ncbi:MAG: hypothetical protein HN719_07910, partial [Alphaproteobacteria bacterium]|nr:hypothetical protein [Alphaproteobacteria bacterium]
GDKTEALSLARQAYRLQPKSAWVADSMFDLQISTGQWLDARVTSDDLHRRKLIDAPTAKRRRAVLNYRLAQEARENGDLDAAEGHLRDAIKLASDFVPAVVDLAGRWVESGKTGKAKKMIEGSWAAGPHPAMLEPYWAACGAGDALSRVRVTKKLVERNSDHSESLIALAKASLEARLWGEARQFLECALAGASGPSAKVCGMMAELEENENGDQTRAREWLVRASQASADAVWLCDHCGNGVGEWTVTCGKCGAFDSYYWRPPASIAGLMHPVEVDVGPEEPEPQSRLIDAGGAAILPPGGVGA